MKKNYSSPKFEFEIFAAADVITVSVFRVVNAGYSYDTDNTLPEINVNNNHFNG